MVRHQEINNDHHQKTPHQQPAEHKLIEVACKCQPGKEAAKQLLVGMILLFF